ncbi:unnamed protein product [Ilex paraguariensis]|uniref:Uncharacterized protein n=1 Tax=Ilex paraguariensis TaxID=185542 RepID=A0ABC8TXF0_9AQUA
MARPLLPEFRTTSLPRAGFAVGSLLLCAFALFMCATHLRKWRKWRSCYGYHDEDPVIQLNPEGLIGEYQIGNNDASTYSGEVSVWKKNILMGGKCQLPDFSGVIIYDSAGNVVPPARKLALPWK